MVRMFRYAESEDGQDFGRTYVLIDGTNGDVSRFTRGRICHSLCIMTGVDGIAVLEKSGDCDFRLRYCDSRGMSVSPSLPSCSSVPWGIALCAVAFADLLGIKPFHSKEWDFRWGELALSARIDSHLGECKSISIFPHSPGSDSSLIRSGNALCLGEFE